MTSAKIKIHYTGQKEESCRNDKSSDLCNKNQCDFITISSGGPPLDIIYFIFAHTHTRCIYDIIRVEKKTNYTHTRAQVCSVRRTFESYFMKIKISLWKYYLYKPRTARDFLPSDDRIDGDEKSDVSYIYCNVNNNDGLKRKIINTR